jgi:hypothetical protein
MTQEQPCPRLLNSNKNVIGPGGMALAWAENAGGEKAANFISFIVDLSCFLTLTPELIWSHLPALAVCTLPQTERV